MSETELAKVDENAGALMRRSTDENAGALMRRSTDAAGVCGEIVRRTVQSVQGRKYIRVEGWQAIAAAHGCTLGASHVEVTDRGVRAVGEVRRISDGVIICTAEGFVGTDEPTWYGGGPKTLPRRSEFAIRAMAQTRAMSRAGRSAFAFVAVLIDSNLSTTPAEEMEAVYGEVVPPAEAGRQAVEAVKARIFRVRPSAPQPPPTQEPPPPTDADAPPGSFSSEATAEATAEASGPVLTFGSAKGKRPANVDVKSLSWYEKVLSENVADPSKSRWAESNQALLDSVRAELHRRGEL